MTKTGRIEIHTRYTAADPVKMTKTFPATPRGAYAAWKEMQDIRDTYRGLGNRPVGCVIDATLDGVSIADGINLYFDYRDGDRLTDIYRRIEKSGLLSDSVTFQRRIYAAEVSE